MLSRLFLLLLALSAALPAHARQDVEPVRKAAEAFLRVHTRGMPGQVSFTVGSIDPRNNLAPCSALDAFAPPGSRPWGRTNVGVRCLDEGGWTVYLPVKVRVVAEYLVTARPLVQGQVIAAADIQVRSGDLGELPPGILTLEEQALGQALRMPLAAGQPIRNDMLRRRPAVQQGQSVKLLSRGPGFAVSGEGRALNTAGDGEVAQVRAPNGQVLSGIARPGGVVEIGY